MENKDIYIKVLKMLEARSKYWKYQWGNYSVASAYESAANMVQAAIEEDWDTLNQFDYYGDAEKENKNVD